MREVLLIFRKDVRHLWPRIVPLLAVTALWGWMECELYANPALGAVRAAWLLAVAYLGASVIHEEPLPGHQQYWLTRPYSRRQLVLAKALFLMAFAGLPTLAMEATALSVNGVSPWLHVRLLLGTLLIFGAGGALVAVALASVTENLVQLLWGFLPAAGVVILALVVAGNDGSWLSLEWVRTAALGAVLLAAAILVLFLQYGLRRTAVSRVLMGAAILVVAAGPFLGSWHGAWALAGKLSGRRIDPSEVRLAFDRSPRPAVSFADAVYSPGPGQAGINLPIVVTGVPAGMKVVCQRIAATIETPDGKSWTSAWIRAGGVYSTTPLEDPHVIREDGPYWQYVALDEPFYRAVKDTPVHVHTSVALTLLGESKAAPLNVDGRTGHLPDGGMCRVDPGPFGSLMVSCAWLARAPTRGYVLARSLKNGQSLASLLSEGSGSPFPLNGSVWDRANTLFSMPPAPLEMQLETWQALSYFERDLDLPQIRLSGYAVKRITDTE